MTKADKATSKT